MRYCCLELFIYRHNLERKDAILEWNTTRFYLEAEQRPDDSAPVS